MQVLSGKGMGDRETSEDSSLGILWEKYIWSQVCCFLWVVGFFKGWSTLSLTCCLSFMVDFYIIAVAITMHALFIFGYHGKKASNLLVKTH
jgi:hypothetical protein